MKAAGTAGVRVATHGRVPAGSADLAAAKVGCLLRVAAEPVPSARVIVAVSADPAVACPAVAQATIDLNGRVVRAQAAGQTVRAAIEQMASRMQVRLGRAAPNWTALRGTIPAAEPGQWRHQSIPAGRPPYFPRPGDQRAVMSHASYAARPQTPEEAAPSWSCWTTTSTCSPSGQPGRTASSTGPRAAIGWPWRTPSRAAWARCPAR